MTSKEIIFRTLQGKSVERVAVAPHWWGHYKFEVSGLHYIKDWYKDGVSMAEVYGKFYETFRPDWFHLHGGTPRYYRFCKVVEEGERFFLINLLGWEPPMSTLYDEIYKDEFLLTHRNLPHLVPESRQQIEEYLEKYVKIDYKSIIEAGFTDHVREIISKWGNEVFVAVHIGSPVGKIFTPHIGLMGFEEAMVALIRKPVLMRYLIERVSELLLEWPRAYANAGCHALIISESEFSSDLISPQMYERFLFDVHRMYFSAISSMGMVPMLCFFGNINPLIPYINKIGIHALMVEESRKGFKNDIIDIRERLDESITLFGNIDPYEVLLKGTEHDVEEAVRMQLEAALKGRFIVSTGSPLIIGTPFNNIKAMIRATHRYGKIKNV
jgi:uroporphyrinogen-III decarboxylase